MTTDETMSAGASGRGGSGKGKGKERASVGEVRPPTRLRPVCTPTTFYKPPDSVQVRVLYEQHFQNVAQEEPCAWDCTMPDCSNRVRTDMVQIGPSNLLRGESGLFARENISEGTVVASFGAVRALRKGEVGTRTQLGYSFIVRETGVVFVQGTRRVEREEEFFANYGDSFRFPHGCQCHLCASTAAV
jgi:hypothetical protein